MTPLIGVLSPTNLNLLWKENGRVKARRLNGRPPLEIMAELGIRQVWLEPAMPAILSQLCPDGWHFEAPQVWWCKFTAPDGRTFHVADAGGAYMAGAWNCWTRASGSVELARELALFVDAIGMLPVAGPGSTGDILIRRTRPDDIEHSRALERPADYAQGDLVWIRPERPAGKYLHAYDCAGQYLSVLGGLRLGIGPRWELTGAEINRAIKAPHDLAAGYWHVVRFPRELEPEWSAELVDRPKRGSLWVTTPALELLLEVCDGDEDFVAVDKAVVCSGYSRVLEPFYKRLHRAREAGGLCAAAAKEVYTRTIGRFASSQWDRAGDPLYRPDWRDSIVAQARANLHRMINHVAAKSGRTPAAVYVDELFYESDSPEPDWVDGALPLARFAHSGTIETDSSMAWKPPASSGRRLRPNVAELVRELRP